MRYLARLLLAFAIVAALIFMDQLMVPLFLSILFAYLLFPAAQRIEQSGIPRIVTNVMLIVGMFVFVSGLAYGIGLLVTMFTDDLSAIQEQVDTNITRFRWALGRMFGVAAAQLDAIVESIRGSGQYIATFLLVLPTPC